MSWSIPNESLDPRAVTLWRLQGMVRFVLFGLPFAVGVAIAVTSISSMALGGVAGGTLALLQLINALVWPSLEYEHYRYEVRDRDLLVQRGVLFRQWSSIPRDRIQHVDTRQGPIERSLGLSRLQVYTAAGMSADGSIPALAVAVSESLRDELSTSVGDDGV